MLDALAHTPTTPHHTTPYRTAPHPSSPHPPHPTPPHPTPPHKPPPHTPRAHHAGSANCTLCLCAIANVINTGLLLNGINVTQLIASTSHQAASDFLLACE